MAFIWFVVLFIACFTVAHSLQASATRGRPYHQIAASSTMKRDRQSEKRRDERLAKKLGTNVQQGVSVDTRRVVWITGYARSGTSTVLSMVADATQGGSDLVFALYEPCQDDDTYEGWLAGSGCQAVLEELGTCNFNSIGDLSGWNNTHTHKPGLVTDSAYNAADATASCNQSSVLAYKTVEINYFEVDLDDLFDAVPNLYILSLVRDPRAIYISEKNTFTDMNITIDRLEEICQGLSKNMNISRNNIYDLKFEDLAKEPQTWMSYTYGLLGLNYSDKQDEWISNTFNASDDCVECAYCDCHKNTSGAMISWRDSISDTELAAFTSSSACQTVANHYNYSLS